MQAIEKEAFDTLKYIILGIIVAYLLNFSLGKALKTDMPVVAVVSDSMTHDKLTPINHYEYLEKNLGFTKEQIDSWPIKNGFLKGDILIVKGTEKLKVGDVIVYNIYGQKVPIVHRIIKIDKDYIITKGDHNPIYDPWQPTKIHGKVIGVIPFLGWPKLILVEVLGVISNAILS